MRTKTDKCLSILEFIVAFKREHDGLSPTFREIAKGMNYGTTTINYHLGELESRGLIAFLGSSEYRRDSRSRAIMVKGGRWEMQG
jgi:DNA-binding MarR family transcriptional regulator